MEMSKTSRTADCLMFAARSEKSSSWRWAEVAARSMASMASAGRTAAAASSVSWVTIPEYSHWLLVRQHLLTKIRCDSEQVRADALPSAGQGMEWSHDVTRAYARSVPVCPGRRVPPDAHGRSCSAGACERVGCRVCPARGEGRGAGDCHLEFGHLVEPGVPGRQPCSAVLGVRRAPQDYRGHGRPGHGGYRSRVRGRGR